MALPYASVADPQATANFEFLGNRLIFGNGTPEGTVRAPQGSLYFRGDGGAGTTLYVKESGATGPTGWVGK